MRLGGCRVSSPSLAFAVAWLNFLKKLLTDCRLCFACAFPWGLSFGRCDFCLSGRQDFTPQGGTDEGPRAKRRAETKPCKGSDAWPSRCLSGEVGCGGIRSADAAILGPPPPHPTLGEGDRACVPCKLRCRTALTQSLQRSLLSSYI
jgi:hypothetical protein